MAKTSKNGLSPSAAGAGVDIYGGPVVDPTKNVLDLVRAESKYQDAMRDAGNDLAEKLRLAEKERINDLAALRHSYDTRIAENLRVEVKTTSEQLAAQLVKETGSLSQQIGALTTSFTNQITTLTASFTNQIGALTNALTPRIADLERFRWEQGGKTSVTDPAVSLAISELSKAIIELKSAGSQTTGRTTGHSEVFAWIVAGVTVLAAIVATAAYFAKAGHI